MPHPAEARALAAGEGLPFPLASNPPLRRWPPRWTVALAEPTSGLRAVIEGLEAQHLLRRIHPGQEPPGMYAKAFAVPKANGGTRMVVDQRALNLHLRPQHFQLQTVSALAPLLATAGSFGLTDARDAFHHVSVDATASRLTRFAIRAAPGAPVEVFEHRGLAMGASCSPSLLQRTVTNVLAAARAVAPPTAVFRAYLDDILTVSSLPPGAAAEEAQTALRQTMAHAGLPPHPEKSLPMATRHTLLGFDVDLPRQRIAVPPSKAAAAAQAIERMLRLDAAGLPVPAKSRAELLGRLASLAAGLRFTRARVASTNAVLTALLRIPPEGDWRAATRAAWRRKAPLLPDERGDLHWWHARLRGLSTEEARWSSANAQPFLLPPPTTSATIVIATDSSDSGYGGHLVLDHPSSPPPLLAAACSSWPTIAERTRLSSPEEALRATRLVGLWTAEELELHITARETIAATRAVLHLARTFDLRGAHVLILSDSSATVATIAKGGSLRPRLAEAFQPLVELQLQTGSHISCAHIPGSSNAYADYLSRITEPRPARSPVPLAVATLSPEATRLLEGDRGPFTLDLFAAPEAHRCQRWVAWKPGDPSSWPPDTPPPVAFDAMAVDWTRLTGSGHALIFPPPRLLPQVAARLLRLPSLRATVVTPSTPSAAWWTILAQRAKPRTLPRGAVTTPEGEPLAWPTSWTSWAC